MIKISKGRGWEKFYTLVRGFDERVEKIVIPKMQEVGEEIEGRARSSAQALFTGSPKKPITGELASKFRTRTINQKSKIGFRVYNWARATAPAYRRGPGPSGRYSTWEPFFARFLEYGTNKSTSARAHTRRRSIKHGFATPSGSRKREGRLRRQLKFRGLIDPALALNAPPLPSVSSTKGEWTSRMRSRVAQDLVWVKRSKVRAYRIPPRPFLGPAGDLVLNRGNGLDRIIEAVGRASQGEENGGD